MISASSSPVKAGLVVVVGVLPSLLHSFAVVPETKRCAVYKYPENRNSFTDPTILARSLNLFRKSKEVDLDQYSNTISHEEVEDNDNKDVATSVQVLYSSDNNDDCKDDESETQNKQKKVILRFGGKYSYKSQIFSYPSSSPSIPSDTVLNDFLFNFFSEEKSQHILLSGGTNSTIQKVSMEGSEYDELLRKWNEKISSSSLEAKMPEPHVDPVVVVTPPGIDILTVSIIPTTTIGTKLTEVDSSIGGQLRKLPEFQATLIEDEPMAQGPKFFVWLFNKIVYGGNPDEIVQHHSSNDRNETALLRFYVEPVTQEDGVNSDGINFAFVAESSMWLEFLFPKLLLRFFPMKKEKAEELCSGAIVKALEKNMKPAMEEFCKEYMHYIQSKSHFTRYLFSTLPNILT